MENRNIKRANALFQLPGKKFEKPDGRVFGWIGIGVQHLIKNNEISSVKLYDRIQNTPSQLWTMGDVYMHQTIRLIYVVYKHSNYRVETLTTAFGDNVVNNAHAQCTFSHAYRANDTWYNQTVHYQQIHSKPFKLNPRVAQFIMLNDR